MQQPSLRLVLPSLLLLAALPARAEILERVVAKVNGDIVTLTDFQARQLAAAQAARIASRPHRGLPAPAERQDPPGRGGRAAPHPARQRPRHADAPRGGARDHRGHQEGEQPRDRCRAHGAAAPRGHEHGRPEALHRAVDPAPPGPPERDRAQDRGLRRGLLRRVPAEEGRLHQARHRDPRGDPGGRGRRAGEGARSSWVARGPGRTSPPSRARTRRRPRRRTAASWASSPTER